MKAGIERMPVPSMILFQQAAGFIVIFAVQICEI